MFSRLNEAVPLNAAEKRNAFGGPVPKAIRTLVEQPFFTTTLPITPKRYRHHDLACKFLLLQHEKRIVDTKKSRLDAFVNEFKEKELNLRTVQLRKAVQANLSKMEKFFRKDDPLLNSPLMCAVYYAMFKDGTLGDSKPGRSRKTLVAFESELEANRKLELEESEDVNFALLEYERIARSPNDASTISFRVGILKDYLEEA